MPPVDDVVSNDKYRPRQTVVGALPCGPSASVARDPSIFSAALAACRRHEPYAVVVMRRGNLVLDDYASGVNAESLLSSSTSMDLRHVTSSKVFTTTTFCPLPGRQCLKIQTPPRQKY